jgi:hypothetical protein
MRNSDGEIAIGPASELVVALYEPLEMLQRAFIVERMTRRVRLQEELDAMLDDMSDEQRALLPETTTRYDQDGLAHTLTYNREARHGDGYMSSSDSSAASASGGSSSSFEVFEL